MSDINGTSGDDTLLGTVGADSINSHAGFDLIFADSGDDLIISRGDGQFYGGAGADLFQIGGGTSFGGDGDDQITIGPHGPGGPVAYGGEGDDAISILRPAHASPTSGILYGGAGDDSIQGGGAFNEIYGGDGNDSLFGGYSNIDGFAFSRDTIDGGAGNDHIYGAGLVYGGDGNDTIHGGGGGRPQSSSDYGGSGDDLIYMAQGNAYGGDGDDTLVGTGGVAVAFLTGGPGADVFESGVVLDFNGAEGDRIKAGGHVTAIVTKFTGHAGEARVEGDRITFDFTGSGHASGTHIFLLGHPFLEPDYFIT